jgi:hypothetical protein
MGQLVPQCFPCSTEEGSGSRNLAPQQLGDFLMLETKLIVQEKYLAQGWWQGSGNLQKEERQLLEWRGAWFGGLLQTHVGGFFLTGKPIEGNSGNPGP